MICWLRKIHQMPDPHWECLICKRLNEESLVVVV